MSPEDSFPPRETPTPPERPRGVEEMMSRLLAQMTAMQAEISGLREEVATFQHSKNSESSTEVVPTTQPMPSNLPKYTEGSNAEALSNAHQFATELKDQALQVNGPLSAVLSTLAGNVESAFNLMNQVENGRTDSNSLIELGRRLASGGATPDETNLDEPSLEIALTARKNAVQHLRALRQRAKEQLGLEIVTPIPGTTHYDANIHTDDYGTPLTATSDDQVNLIGRLKNPGLIVRGQVVTKAEVGRYTKTGTPPAPTTNSGSIF